MKKFIAFAIVIIAGTSMYAQVQCFNDSTGLVPLNDLGTNYYNGIQGGLYLSGTNEMPINHKKKGNAYSREFKPLDTLGNVNYETGEILLLAFGASITANAINAVGDSLVATDYQGVNNCLNIKSMCFGGKDLNYMIDTTSDHYWDEVRTRMALRGDAYAQVQIAWIMQQSDEDSTGDFLTYYNSVSAKYITLFQMMQDTFPNLKQIFISGIHYTGYMDPNHKRFPSFSSPHDYWGNLVIRDIITRQINGDSLLNYRGPAPKCPWLGWGPYWWADGANMRGGDSLNWTCDQFRSDSTGGGFHLINEPQALGVQAHMLIDFFETNPVAKTWYLESSLWAGCPEDTIRKSNTINAAMHELSVYPNPAQQNILLKLPYPIDGAFTISMISETGNVVAEYNFASFTALSIPLTINVPNGMYFIKVISNKAQLTTKLIMQ